MVKLYEYARNNETVERPKRKVNIKDIGRISELDLKKMSVILKYVSSWQRYIY